MNDYVKKLEDIASFHLAPPPAHLVDCKAQALDREKLLPFIQGPRVLELGCGDGVWTSRLIELFGEAHVVDASSKLLAEVKRRYGAHVHCHESLFEAFAPPADKPFNTVVATHMLEHVDDPVRVLGCVRRWLAPGGRVIVVVPNARSFHRQLAVRMGIQKTVYDFSPVDRAVGHVRVYDLEALRKDVLAAGFRTVMERGLFLKILPNSMMTGFSDELLKALVDASDDLPAHWMANLAMVLEPAP